MLLFFLFTFILFPICFNCTHIDGTRSHAQILCDPCVAFQVLFTVIGNKFYFIWFYYQKWYRFIQGYWKLISYYWNCVYKISPLLANQTSDNTCYKHLLRCPWLLHYITSKYLTNIQRNSFFFIYIYYTVIHLLPNGQTELVIQAVLNLYTQYLVFETNNCNSYIVRNKQINKPCRYFKIFFTDVQGFVWRH